MAGVVRYKIRTSTKVKITGFLGMRDKDFTQEIVVKGDKVLPSSNVATKVLKKCLWQYVLLRTQVFNHQFKHIIIVCPARTGSTLVSHLVGGHPEIGGYGEWHVSYTSKEDLLYLVSRNSWFFRDFGLKSKFHMDKVVHNYLHISPEILSSDKVFFIFLLRNPLDTLASMLKLWFNCTEESIQKYYCQRIGLMTDYAELINSKDRAFFLSYDALLENSSQVLSNLQNFLGLDIPFSEKYSLCHRKYEYNSSMFESLKTGQLTKKHDCSPKKYNFHTEYFSDSVAAYHSCVETLNKYCFVCSV